MAFQAFNLPHFLSRLSGTNSKISFLLSCAIHKSLFPTRRDSYTCDSREKTKTKWMLLLLFIFTERDMPNCIIPSSSLVALAQAECYALPSFIFGGQVLLEEVLFILFVLWALGWGWGGGAGVRKLCTWERGTQRLLFSLCLPSLPSGGCNCEKLMEIA